MLTSNLDRNGRILGIKRLNAAFWSGMENLSYLSRNAKHEIQLSFYLYESYNFYLQYLISTLEQLSNDYLPVIECNQLSAYIKGELRKGLLFLYYGRANLKNFLNNYILFQKFFIKKNEDQLENLSFLDECPKEIIAELANNIEVLIQLMLEQGRNMQDERLAHLVNIWLEIPQNEKSVYTILADLSRIEKSDPDQYRSLFDTILKKINLIKMPIIEFKKLVENLINTDRHECVQELYKKCSASYIENYKQIIIDNINQHPEKRQDYSNYKNIKKMIDAAQNKALENKDSKDETNEVFSIKPSLEDQFEEFINEHKNNLSTLRSVSELKKYLDDPNSTDESWVVYLCERLGGYPSLTDALKKQILQILAQDLSKIKYENLSENLDKYFIILNRFFPDINNVDRLNIMSQLLEALLKVYPNLEPGRQDIVVNYQWQAIDLFNSNTIYLKLLPDKPISLSKEGGDKSMPFTMLWTSLAFLNSDDRIKISTEYERFISQFGDGYEKFLFQYQFVINRLMLSMKENVFEFLLQHKTKMASPDFEDMMLSIAMLPISKIDVIGQLLEKFSASIIDYKTLNEIIIIAKAQLKICKLMDSPDYKDQVDFYQKLMQESASLDDFYQNISGHLLDTAFPHIDIDKSKANLPHFFQEIDSGNFATYIDKRKYVPFEKIYDEMLVYALIECPMASIAPVQSEEKFDPESSEQSSKVRFLRECMPEYKKFADNFKNINRGLTKDERDFTEFFITHNSVILQLMFIMGKDAFRFLQNYMGKTVLPLEGLLKNLSIEFPGNLLETLYNTLQQAQIFTQDNFATFCANAKYAASLTSGLVTLNQAEILTQESFDTLCANAQFAASLAPVLSTLNQAGMLTQKNFTALCASAQYADSLSSGLDTLNQAGMLTKENCALLCANAQYANSLAWAINIFNGAGIKTEELAPLSLDKIFKYIYMDNTGKFSDHEKITAFFILVSSQEELVKKPTSSKINKMVSEIQPEQLRMRLKKILNRMGAYNFMQKEVNATLGVEIEYSNIPIKYKRITEWVMGHLQKGWSHPGDGTVQMIGDSTYSGETTTPIISNTSELEHAMFNMAFLEAMGGETNASCGLHVHIGVENIATPPEFKEADKIVEDANMSRSYTVYQLEFIKQFLMIYKREELKFSSIERDYNKYTQAVVVDDINKIENLSVLTSQVNPGGRYYELNLHAFAKHGTIEVRRFSGTTEEAQIYSTISMITAMAQEAKTRTNAIFKKKCFPDATQDTSYESLNLFSRQKTESQRELFMLRVKRGQESVLTVNPTTSERKSKTVYIYLNKDGLIAYEAIDKNNKLAKGIIEEAGKFAHIIDKLKSNLDLDTKEKNQILQEVASRSHAIISHPVEKMASASGPRLVEALRKRKI